MTTPLAASRSKEAKFNFKFHCFKKTPLFVVEGGTAAKKEYVTCITSQPCTFIDASLTFRAKSQAAMLRTTPAIDDNPTWQNPH
eukprot:scaffold30796_cov43-Prasinocladus_malaysianus.AAC.2